MLSGSEHGSFALITLLLSISLAAYLRARSGRQRLAPGPKAHWFLGNAAQIPAEKPWLWYTKLHEEYGAAVNVVEPRIYSWSLVIAGDVVRLTVPGRDLIILNTLESVQDLFMGRSTIYSDRGRQVMTGEM